MRLFMHPVYSIQCLPPVHHHVRNCSCDTVAAYLTPPQSHSTIDSFPLPCSSPPHFAPTEILQPLILLPQCSGKIAPLTTLQHQIPAIEAR